LFAGERAAVPKPFGAECRAFSVNVTANAAVVRNQLASLSPFGEDEIRISISTPKSMNGKQSLTW